MVTWGTILAEYRRNISTAATAGDGIKFERVVSGMGALGSYFRARRLGVERKNDLVESLMFLPLGSQTQLFATKPWGLGANHLEDTVSELTSSAMLIPDSPQFPAVDVLLFGLRELIILVMAAQMRMVCSRKESRVLSKSL